MPASPTPAGKRTRLTNIEYAQADILKLGSLDLRFDVIEAVGILHHLGNPEAGWRTLLSLLRPGGLLLVGLYSALARRSITTARARIADWGYRSSPAHIRECRQELIKRRLQAASPDFFTASGFRDLYLRVAERQFTVADIASWVQVAGVKFRGFEIDDSLREQFDERHHGANSQDLSAWDVFEQGLSARLRQHVPVFGSEAWARKIEQGQGPAQISSG